MRAADTKSYTFATMESTIQQKAELPGQPCGGGGRPRLSLSNLGERLVDWLSRSQVYGFFISLAVLAAVSVLYFYPDNLEHNTLQQPDMVQGAANGQEGKAYEEATGQKALWTNSLFGGMPTFQISPSYPSNQLYDWLNDALGLWLPAPSNLMMMMMVGFLVLLYAFGMRWYYALIGSLMWGLSSYFVIIIGAGHIWKFVALSYIPPTIAGMVLCYRGRLLGGTALTALFAMLQLNANHPQMSYYFAFVMAGMAIAYLCTAIRQRQVGRWAVASICVAAAGALALGANLPALYNTYEYSKQTSRNASELTPVAKGKQQAADAKRPTGGMDYDQIVAWSYTPEESLTLLIPNLKGGSTSLPVGGTNQMMPLSQLDAAANVDIDPRDAQLLDYLPQYFNDTEGTNGPVYVGAVVFALFVLGCFIVKGPMKWTLLALTLLSIVLAWGRHFEWFTDLMIYNLPMYNKFRAVESILVIAEFTMPLLGILGLAQLLSVERPLKRYRWQLWVAAGLPALICLVALCFPSLFGPAITGDESQAISAYASQGYLADVRSLRAAIESLRYGMVSRDAARSLLFIVVAAVAVWGFIKLELPKFGIVLTLGVLVLLDMLSVDKRYLSHDSFVTPGIETADPLAMDEVDKVILQDKDLSYRVADFDNFGGARRSYYHKMIGGYHAAKLGRYNDLITRGMITKPQVLDMLNTRYFIQNGVGSMNPFACGNAWFVDTLDYVKGADAEFSALGKLDSPKTRAVADQSFNATLGAAVHGSSAAGSVKLTAYTPNQLSYDVSSPQGGVVVFSEVYFPWGWHATIDGKPAQLGRVNYVLRAMRVPAGQHKVVMTFDPQSLHTTGNIAYVSVTLIYLLVLAAVLLPCFWCGKKRCTSEPLKDQEC